MSMIEKTREALLSLYPDQVAASDDPEKKEEESAQEEAAAGEERQPGVMITDYMTRGTHLDLLCEADQVVAAAEIMDRLGYFLEAISGVDRIKEKKMEVIYDYNRSDEQACRVVVRAFLPREKPEIPTVSEVFPAASWHERETHDFFGIRFTGHPYLVPLLLPEDADFHPLLKDFKP